MVPDRGQAEDRAAAGADAGEDDLEGGKRPTGPGGVAGGEESRGAEKVEKEKTVGPKELVGPKLGPEEVLKAKERAGCFREAFMLGLSYAHGLQPAVMPESPH